MPAPHETWTLPKEENFPVEEIAGRTLSGREYTCTAQSIEYQNPHLGAQMYQTYDHGQWPPLEQLNGVLFDDNTIAYSRGTSFHLIEDTVRPKGKEIEAVGHFCVKTVVGDAAPGITIYAYEQHNAAAIAGYLRRSTPPSTGDSLYLRVLAKDLHVLYQGPLHRFSIDSEQNA